jgi:hypothetical protein
MIVTNTRPISATVRRAIRGALLALFAVTISSSPAVWAQGSSSQPDFGPNVYLFTPSMPAAQIQSTLLSLANEPQFSTNRYAILFTPGAYNLQAPVGYYESIAGLGLSPGAVTINGFLTPNYGQAVYGTPTWPQANLTDTFWRSMENLTIDPVQNTAQNAAPSTLQWGVSQGAPLRRMQINGSLELVNSYCGEASGGFISDLVVTGNVNPCSQQQWFTRNSSLGSWTGGVWNMVFSGVEGAPQQSFPAPPETVVPTTPVSREKPFLYVDSRGNFNVFSPSAQRNSTGPTWASKNTPGRSIPINRFFIAKPSMSAAEINLALVLGKNLIFTPGIYQLNQSLNVLYPDTVILGLGYATLVPQTGKAAITVADVDGVQIAGLIIDAGPVNSPVLLKMGAGLFDLPLPRGGFFSHWSDPSSINDVFFRIGGATAGSATTTLEVDSADVILDDIWAWRADHGNGVGWTENTASHGLVVNGNRVTALGLAVEHYQQEQVLWNGDAGQTIFYQSELPYDPPSQSAWTDGGANGYPSYVVSSSVRTHQAWGLGIYSFFNQGVNIIDDNAMTVPEGSGIAIHDAGTVWLAGSGQITNVINGTGAAVDSSNADVLSPVVTYP